MYIACPKCGTNFTVLPNQIGVFGRKVKCSKCSNVWYQTLPPSIELDTVIATPSFTPNLHEKINISNGVNLPALLPIKIPQYLQILPVIMVALIIFLCIILFQDKFGFSSVINSHALSINDVKIRHDIKRAKIIVNYKVANSAHYQVGMPLVRIRLFDKNNRVIKSHVTDRTNITLAPKQYVGIRTDFDAVPKTAEILDITLGSKIDFILR
jgi:predicted Zn finger-like uncharacterized protein